MLMLSVSVTWPETVTVYSLAYSSFDAWLIVAVFKVSSYDRLVDTVVDPMVRTKRALVMEPAFMASEKTTVIGSLTSTAVAPSEGLVAATVGLAESLAPLVQP